MSFKDFVASHTGRHFFDAFREFVVAFKTYVGHLTLHNQITQAQLDQRVAEFQQEVDAVDQSTPDSMSCIHCTELCSPAVSVLIGWRGVVSLLCVSCARATGVLDDSQTN